MFQDLLADLGFEADQRQTNTRLNNEDCCCHEKSVSVKKLRFRQGMVPLYEAEIDCYPFSISAFSMAMIYRYFILCVCLLTSSLYSYSDSNWVDDEDYYSVSMGSFSVSYGGISFECDSGCGYLDSDTTAMSIHKLCDYWVIKPLFPYDCSVQMDAQTKSLFGLSPFSGTLNLKIFPFESDEDFGIPYSEFIQTSSDFLEQILEEKYQFEAKLREHEQKKLATEELKAKGARYIDIVNGKVKGHEKGSYSFDTVKQALQSEETSFEYQKECIRKCNEYEKYVENAFRTIDSLYGQIFQRCLEKHQPEGTVFKSALESYVAKDYDIAIEQIRYLISLLEAHPKGDELLSQLYLLKGQVESEFILYSDAVSSLSTAIKKDPSQKDAYFERAVAYFDLGDYEKSIENHLLCKEGLALSQNKQQE